MIMGRITLWGFYKYDPNLFEDCIFPEVGDLNLCIEVIMQKHGMQFPYHQSHPQLKQNIQNFFHRYYENWGRIFTSVQAEYNPIENYDRHEEWTDTPNVDITHTGGHTNTYGINTNTVTNNEVSAFNSETYTPDGKSTSVQTGNNTDTFTYQLEKSSETGTRKHDGHLHGNIGVTTNQQMISAEIELRQYEIYDNIASIFEKEFLSQVY